MSWDQVSYSAILGIKRELRGKKKIIAWAFRKENWFWNN